MRQEESVPVPRGWTGKAACEGAGASLLLHLFVGAAVVVALSGPPKSAPLMVDLTLLPPAGTDRHPAPPVFAAAKPARVRERSVLPEPPALPVLPTVAVPPDVTAAAIPSGPEADGIAPAAPPPHAAASPATAQEPVQAGAWSPPGRPDARSPKVDVAWVRDAIQNAIAYPPTARRMGWEGKVVVAFRLLPDGSIRDVRVVQGSGHAALDRGAIDAVRSASPFPRSPVEAEVITPVVYRLTTR
jgi:protein TonB